MPGEKKLEDLLPVLEEQEVPFSRKDSQSTSGKHLGHVVRHRPGRAGVLLPVPDVDFDWNLFELEPPRRREQSKLGQETSNSASGRLCVALNEHAPHRGLIDNRTIAIREISSELLEETIRVSARTC